MIAKIADVFLIARKNRSHDMETGLKANGQVTLENETYLIKS